MAGVKRPRVLVLYERSGVVRRALRAAGADAWSCDLEPADDGSGYHHQGEALALLYEEPGYGPWDLVIAHPPCTYLCNSGAGRMVHTPSNPSPGILYGSARRAAMRKAAREVSFVWTAPVPALVIENPVMHGHATRSIAYYTKDHPLKWPARPTQTIQPYQFGDNASKRTCLWVRGVSALIVPHEEQWIAPRIVAGKPRWGNQTDSGQNKLPPSAQRGYERAVTYNGIAKAMAEQWVRELRGGR